MCALAVAWQRVLHGSLVSKVVRPRRCDLFTHRLFCVCELGQSMRKMKAGTANSTAVAELAAASSDRQEDAAAAAVPEVDEPLQFQSHADMQVDPIDERANALVNKELTHIAMHYTEDAFVADATARIFPTHKAIVYIDAPTSKTRPDSDSLARGRFCQLTATW